jgi:hypothetical protein
MLRYLPKEHLRQEAEIESEGLSRGLVGTHRVDHTLWKKSISRAWPVYCYKIFSQEELRVVSQMEVLEFAWKLDFHERGLLKVQGFVTVGCTMHVPTMSYISSCLDSKADDD